MDYSVTFRQEEDDDSFLSWAISPPHSPLDLVDCFPTPAVPLAEPPPLPSAFVPYRGFTAEPGKSTTMDYSFTFRQEEDDDSFLSWAISPPHSPFDLVDCFPTPAVPLAEPPPLPSAFVPYRGFTGAVMRSGDVGDRAQNIHWRLIQLLRAIREGSRPPRLEEALAGSGRDYRHRMRERVRREKINWSFAELNSLLSFRPKGSRVSIVQSAGEYLLELQKERERLRERSRELELMVYGNVKEAASSRLVKVEMEISSSASPASWSFDSVISVLRRLKQMEAEAATIAARHSGRNLAVEVGFEAEVDKKEVEKAMKAAALAESGRRRSLQLDGVDSQEHSLLRETELRKLSRKVSAIYHEFSSEGNPKTQIY